MNSKTPKDGFRRSVPKIKLNNEYIDVKRDLSTDALAKVGALILAWNGIEYWMEAILESVVNLPPELAESLTKHVNGSDHKSQVIIDFLPGKLGEAFGSWLPKFIDTITSAAAIKAWRDSVAHTLIADPALAIGAGKTKNSKAYEIHISNEILDRVYEEIVLLTNEMMSIGIVISFINSLEKGGYKIESRTYNWLRSFCDLALDRYTTFSKARADLPVIPVKKDTRKLPTTGERLWSFIKFFAGLENAYQTVKKKDKNPPG